MKTMVAAFLLFIVSPAVQAFQSHPQSHKVAKHKTKGDHRHHLPWKKN